MNFLSAEEINQTSPYKVTQVDEMSVRFCTQNGVHYWVGLVNDIFMPLISRALDYDLTEAKLVLKEAVMDGDEVVKEARPAKWVANVMNERTFKDATDEYFSRKAEEQLKKWGIAV